MLKSSVLYSTIVTATLLVPAVFGPVIKASANNTKPTNSVSKAVAIAAPKQHVIRNTSLDSHSLSELQINKVDSYILVVNNQYQLNKRATTILSNTELQAVENSISIANTTVKQQHLTIDQKTKTSQPMSNTKAAWHSYYTSANFWWGTRYYFTSNAAVAQMQNELANYSIALGITGALGGALSVGGAAIVSAGADAYLTKMSSDLGYYNATHLHNQIYMDVNFAGFYSMHVLA
ncbi:hypothetical protein [Lactiplantibacillus plantarum]|uniref:hypothetical protein n=1 Tax=Lactiplantibacillus plantarum TaxID=1590 RepID=UPI0010822EC5|nr:hypothetical protein [Lactiplantibacillus plantarum]QBX95158.1 hypothetical protein DVH03_12860 [Lactiplantibacillus plantarum]